MLFIYLFTKQQDHQNQRASHHEEDINYFSMWKIV